MCSKFSLVRRSSPRRGLAAGLSIWLCSLVVAFAQSPGSLDSNFFPFLPGGANVNSVAVQPDGKVLVAGGSVGVRRLNPDGSPDNNFSAPDVGGTPLNIYVQPDGRILFCGNFSSVDGYTLNNVARLNADGSLDTSFNPVTPSNPGFGIIAVGLQADGKIILSGYSFYDSSGVQRDNIGRLNSDGSYDTTFAPNQLSNGLFSIAVQPDGKIILGGNFTSVGTTASNGIARLNSDGSLDTTFNPGSGVTFSTSSTPGTVRAIGVRSDGKIVIGGSFSLFAGSTEYNIAVLNADGTLDAAESPSVEADSTVYSLAVQSDNKAVVGGDFIYANGVQSPNLACFNPNGSYDSAFNTGAGPNGSVMGMTLTSDAKVYIAGSFNAYNGDTLNGTARIYADLAATQLAFFSGSEALGNGVYYLLFGNGNFYGYYSYLSNPHYIYHFDMGYEYLFDAADGKGGIYFYDFKSNDFFYSSPSFSFPYLYDFNLRSVVYYYPDPVNAGHYNTNGIRYFYVFNTGQIITK